MNRRTILLGGAAVAAGALTLSSTVQTVVFGHAKDAISRITPDKELTVGNITHRGTIREDDPGQDPIHRAGGTVTITSNGADRVLQLNSDFWSTVGPDYHVYISDTLNIVDEKTFKAADQYEVGRLQKGNGASEYKLPALLDLGNVSVTIWCKAFGEFIGSANVTRL